MISYMKARIAERGQITIPKALRDKLGLRPGAQLDFSINGKQLIAVKAEEADPVARVTGCLKLGKSTEVLLDELRGKV